MPENPNLLSRSTWGLLDEGGLLESPGALQH